MDRFVRVLLYGEQGNWKTVTALRYDDNNRVYATDDGYVSAYNHPEWIDFSKVEIIPYQGRKQLLDEKFDSPHTTITLDTMSEMMEDYLDLLMTKGSWGKYRDIINTNSKELQNLANPAPHDYQAIRNQWRPVARKFLSAPKDIFILSHENDPIEGLSKDMTRKPNMPNKAFKAIGQNCHVIGRMIKKPGGKEILIDVRETNARIVAKSRISTIHGEMTVDDFLTALKKWKNDG